METYATVWMILLLFMGIFMICVEMVIPGGIVGSIGIVAILASIVIAFVELQAGWAALYASFALIVCAVAIYLMVRAILTTRLGGKIMLRKNLQESKSFDEERAGFKGKEGKALTDLRPAGTAIVDGRRMDVVTEGIYIAKGSPVRVVDVEGSRIVVRTVEGP